MDQNIVLSNKKVMVLDTEYDTNPKRLLALAYIIYPSEDTGNKVKSINLKLAKLHDSLFVESSPGPVKYAAELLGLCSGETRLPLAPITEETKKLVSLSMKEAGLIDQ